RTCANLAEGRRIERPWLITMPRFSGPVADHSAVPSPLAESAGVEPASLLRELLCSRQVPYRPAHSPFITFHPYPSLRRPRPLLARSRRSHWLTRFLEGSAVNRFTLATVRAPLPIANCQLLFFGRPGGI